MIQINEAMRMRPIEPENSNPKKLTSKIFNDSTAYIYSETTIIHTCLKIHLIKNIIQNDKINNNLYIEYNIVKEMYIRYILLYNENSY